MVKVSDEQVDFILREIRAHGVTIDDLQWNLLDHMCCIIENEMSETDNFEQFFQRLLPRFFNDNLREIQEETELLLTFKHFYAMKRTLNISGLLAAVLTLTGSVLKVLHLPGASIGIVFGIAIFCLIFLPLMIALKFRDETSQIDKWVLSFGFLLGITCSLGFLFKIQHWPYANIIMMTGLMTFLFFYVPIYFFSRIRKPELKFNTTVNAVLMIASGGLLFGMYNLKATPGMEDANREAYRLLNDEIHKVEASQRLNKDADRQKELPAEIAQLEDEIAAMKREVMLCSGKFEEKDLAKMSEAEVYSELPRDDAMKYNLTPAIVRKWEKVKRLFTSLNIQLNKEFPDADWLHFDIDAIQLEINSPKVALQNLSLMQLHLRLIKANLS